MFHDNGNGTWHAAFNLCANSLQARWVRTNRGRQPVRFALGHPFGTLSRPGGRINLPSVSLTTTASFIRTPPFLTRCRLFKKILSSPNASCRPPGADQSILRPGRMPI
jgi:hypothetical protein